MNAKNNYLRQWLGVDAWHAKGYTGSRGLTLSAESPAYSINRRHARLTEYVFHEIAPDRAVQFCRYHNNDCDAKIDGYGKANFEDAVKASGADTMYMSIDSAAYSSLDLPVAFSFFAAAGNHAGDDYNDRIADLGVYGVGAVSLGYTATVNGKPAPGAKLQLQVPDYTSESEYVDFAGLTDFYISETTGEKLDGTSCACPVVCGLAALVNDFFIDKTGRPLSTAAMYRFLRDCSYDVGIVGRDGYTGYGVPRLPDPDTIDISKYSETEECSLTVNLLLTAAKAEVGTKESPSGSNTVKYNTEFYGKTVSGSSYSWCLVFIWWLFRQLGASDKFYGGGKCASCTTFYNWYKARGMTVAEGYRPGDIVFYDWDKSGDCDHVGILYSRDGSGCKVIEGNTAVGNDSNGGEVMMRERCTSQFKGAVRVNFDEEDDNMTGNEIIAALTDEQAYELVNKAQTYAAGLSVPADMEPEFAKAKTDGITDGERPMQLLTRWQGAIMADRAK